MAPKTAKPTKATAAKTTTKPAAKGGVKGGVKAPFAQPRKAAPPKEKLDDMTEEEWDHDKIRRRIATQDRSNRRKKAAVKQSEAQRNSAAVAHMAAMISGNYHSGTQSSSASRHSATPSPGSFFPPQDTPLSRFSSDWADRKSVV